MQKNRITPKDYPLATKIPNLIKTPTGKKLEDITLESVMSQDIKPEDIRISKETLEMQAQVAEGMNRNAIARNFRRAGELISVPDERILEIYNALRPFRSTKEELLEIADELENIYNAKVNADFIREAAEVYEVRKKLRIE
ncbi:diol dehydratase small subunit [Romboutsia hominis]|uniref:Propanediol dehydratase small subunit n=1 Tax=Romboutsia hominis TaxID=1507512 RepID=A0A2P2BQH7_9FIRM|nr:diol dehydratase small subunit [Romboutsia hominis]CEI72599.1 Propanediol dehydratase small subunit [Romboutsia hominis]